MTIRPIGVVVSGRLELGVELVVEGGQIVEIRPHTGIPEPFVVSPAFVNAHSHLEYRGLMGRLGSLEYWSWIREITELKKSQNPPEVAADCSLAARENRQAGVALIAEHSDRPGAAEALSEAGIGGAIFQELITVLEGEGREQRVRDVRTRARANADVFDGPVWIAPHARFTVDEETLAALGASGEPVSIHVAETPHESELTRSGSGPIAEFYRGNGIPVAPSELGVVADLGRLGLLRSGVQFVHACSLDEGDIEAMARAGVSVAHCPRSNARLRCPIAPVRRMLDAGIEVGLGLDSAASSGPIDMFAEMGAALDASASIGEPLTAEQVWEVANGKGHRSLFPFLGTASSGDWSIAVGSQVPLIGIRTRDAQTVGDLIERGTPDQVFWITSDER